MQPDYVEIIALDDSERSVTSRLFAKFLGSRVAEFVRRPAVTNTLRATAVVLGGWAVYELTNWAMDVAQHYQDIATTNEMFDELMRSGPEVHNQMQNGADFDYSQYTQ
jgi:hypothetical protein